MQVGSSDEVRGLLVLVRVQRSVSSSVSSVTLLQVFVGDFGFTLCSCLFTPLLNSHRENTG